MPSLSAKSRSSRPVLPRPPKVDPRRGAVDISPPVFPKRFAMDPFKLRKLGRSNVMLPQMGFGGAPLGDLFTKVSEADAEATLDAAWQGGVRYYDTAPWYGRGQSEHRIGRFLYRQPRNEVLLSTKVGRIFRAPANPARSPTDGVTGWAGGLQFEH